jgi:hypothetical protein
MWQTTGGRVDFSSLGNFDPKFIFEGVEFNIEGHATFTQAKLREFSMVSRYQLIMVIFKSIVIISQSI